MLGKNSPQTTTDAPNSALEKYPFILAYIMPMKIISIGIVQVSFHRLISPYYRNIIIFLQNAEPILSCSHSFALSYAFSCA